MAEGILRDRIATRGEPAGSWRISSAGINPQEGIPASRYSEEVMKERGIDIFSHHARLASEQIIAEHNLVLTMEKVHKSILLARFPQYAERFFMLSEMIEQEFPVDDPFGSTLEDYRRTANVISRVIDEGMETIVRLSKGGG
jgi:protein-tyrosine-phosphatase